MVLTSGLRSRFPTGASRAQSLRSFVMNVKSILLLAMLFVCFEQSLRGQAQMDQKDTIPSVTFCEMVKEPQLYFGKTIRITATYEIRTEGSTLNHQLCRRSHDDQIGANAVRIDDEQVRLVSRDFARIWAKTAGIHPQVTAVGILRNVSRRAFVSYRYRFDIIRFDDIQKRIPEQSLGDKVTTVDFCELAKNPQRYFNRTVRIKAQWLSGYEFSYLTNDRCPTKVAHDIAVEFVNDETQREIIKQSVYKIMSHEYGGRAMITAVGVLRNPGQYYGYFRYLFELIRFEEIVHVVVPYESTLDAGKTYRAVVRGDKELGLVLVPPLRMFSHQALSIEWTNLSEFPALENLRDSSAQQLIVFSVISNEYKQITAQRWNRTVKCKIVRIE
jgi:acetyltransferase-like isoleucine patch superfamily enzyme